MRFGEMGLECQMEDVARSAGVGVGTVYRHFPNKEALIEALIERRFERSPRGPPRPSSRTIPGRPSAS